MDPEFAAWSKDVVLFCHITSQVPGDPHQDLLEKKGGRGFPHLVFLDADGEVLMPYEGPRTVEGFRQGSKKVQAMLDLGKKAKGGDKAAKFDWAEMRAGNGRLDADGFEKEIAGISPLTKEQEAKAGSVRAGFEVRGILATVTRDRKSQVAAGQKFLEMKKAGRIPQGEQETQPFWILIMGTADDAKDPALFEEALNVLKGKFGGMEGSEGFFQKAEKRLGELKAQGKP